MKRDLKPVRYDQYTRRSREEIIMLKVSYELWKQTIPPAKNRDAINMFKMEAPRRDLFNTSLDLNGSQQWKRASLSKLMLNLE